MLVLGSRLRGERGCSEPDGFGSRPFSAINAALEAHGQKKIDWQIPPTS